jgi:hypothetical protein
MNHGLSQRSGVVSCHHFFCSGVNQLLPIVDLGWERTEIGFFNTDSDDAVSHLHEVAIDLFGSVEVSNSGVGTKAGECHDGSSDVESSNLDDPLERTNEGLVFLDVLKLKFFRVVDFWMITVFEWR